MFLRRTASQRHYLNITTHKATRPCTRISYFATMPAKKRSAPPPATGNAGPDGHEAADDVPKRARRSLRSATRGTELKESQGNGGQLDEGKQKSPAISKQKRVKAEKDAANTPIPISTTRQPSPEASPVSRSYWLIKSEPTTRLVNGIDVKFSIDDLASIGDAGEGWNGVRNYAARNNIRNMRLGDKVLFYHSNCKVGSSFLDSQC